jgi:aspartyl-tRNA(Asn)/glutamyl-tRNA(Gln) amidotransferase subunit B
MADFEAVIGLEVHVQLDTRRKSFSNAPSGYGDGPNQQTDPTVLGLPGALPVFNQAALEHAVKLGLAVGSTIRRESRFARKHYFYPDLPKGYQISQYEEPICEGGAISFWLDGERKEVGLTRIHLEEDAGKSTHHAAGYSLVDLNRAGVPLCEVVSEPVLRSPREAAEYMRALRQLVRYLGVSSGDMEKGHLRCDANVSLRPRGQTTLGTRTELKNINSFRFVEDAITHEIARQTGILSSGGHIVQETRLWDSDRGTSQSMRTKEEAEDYRYFPDPDLPPMILDDEFIETQRRALPELPMATIDRLLAASLPLADAQQLAAEPELARFVSKAVAAVKAEQTKPVANWILSVGRSIVDTPVAPESLGELVSLIDNGTISGKIGKDVLKKMMETGDSAKSIVEREGLLQITDTSELKKIAQQIIDANPAQRDQYRAGKDKLISFFVGQLMKATQGKANPELAQTIFKELLQ